MNRTAAIIFITAICLFPAGRAYSGGAPQVKNGIIDLREWHFDRQGPVGLNGPWEFHWRRFIGPSEAMNRTGAAADYFPLPGSWAGYTFRSTRLGSDGYASFRLRILLGGATGPLALKLGEINTAYRLFINGTAAGGGGVPGMSAGVSVPGWSPGIVSFIPAKNEIELLFHVSNYDYYKSGIRGSLTIGNERDLFLARERRMVYDLILIGILLIMGMYHFGLFFYRRADRSLIYFSAFCALVAVYHLSIGEVYFMRAISGAWWEVLIKSSFIPIFIGTPLFIGYIGCVFPGEVPRLPFRAFMAAGLAFTALCLATPARIYSPLLPVYHAIIGAAILFMIAVMVRALRRRREGSILFTVGVSGFLICIINDILIYEDLLATMDLAPLGVVFLILSQGILLARRYSHAARMMEELTLKNDRLQEKLDMTEDADRQYVITEATEGKIKQSLDYLRDNFREEISREGLAASLNMHPDNFGRLFKLYTGKKIGDVINEFRVREALRMLKDTDRTVLDIALDVGFENLRTFNRAFKKIMKNTPKAFRTAP